MSKDKPPRARLLKGGTPTTSTELAVDDQKRVIALRHARRRRFVIPVLMLASAVGGFVSGMSALPRVAVSAVLLVPAFLFLRRYGETAATVVRSADRACDRGRFDRAEKILDGFEAMAPEHVGDPRIAHVRARIAVARGGGAVALAQPEAIDPAPVGRKGGVAGELQRIEELLRSGRADEALERLKALPRTKTDGSWKLQEWRRRLDQDARWRNAK